MKRVALFLATIGVLGLATSQASAQNAISYPMSAQAAAKYGIQHPGLPAVVREAAWRSAHSHGYGEHGDSHHGYGDHGDCHHGYSGHGYSGHYGYHSYPGYYGYRRPVTVYPPIYRSPSYYGFGPYRSGLQYYGRGFSFGFGF